MPINFFRHISVSEDALVRGSAPASNLEDFVEGFYSFKTGVLDEKRLFFNDGYPVLALMQNRESSMRININGRIQTFGNTWVCGGLLKNIYCESFIHAEEVFVVRFHPPAFFRFFQIPANMFERNPVFDPGKFISDLDILSASFYNNSSFDHRVETVEAFLSLRVNETGNHHLVTDLIRGIEEGRAATVKGLTKSSGARLNYKWLERNFRKHVGISPKQYLSLKRFLGVYQSLEAQPGRSLLETALEHGYCDEHHLIKDFRGFSGQSPRYYFRKKIQG